VTDNPPSARLNLSEIKEIDIFVMRRLQELTGGDHKSVFRGAGFDFVGLRDWQPGDKLSSIDWPQSTMNNFDPLVVREFEEDKNGTILIVADASLSMDCGIDGSSSKDIVSRTIATIGLSGVFFQDLTGLFIFDHKYDYGHVKPRMGKNHVVSCISEYVRPKFPYSAGNRSNMVSKILGRLRRASMVPIISDFLFPGALDFVDVISNIKSRHDPFIVLVQNSFLFDLPLVSSGWIECMDAESGKKTLLSRREFGQMSKRVIEYQDGIVQKAKERGIEVVRAGRDKNKFYNDLAEFFFNRKTKRKLVI